MSQQLQLFPETISSKNGSKDLKKDDSADLLLTETKLLFQHHGSNAELIERILTAIRAIKSLHEKSDTQSIAN